MTYQAYCKTCGWEAPNVRSTEDAALTDGGEHEVAISEGAPTDAHHNTAVRS